MSIYNEPLSWLSESIDSILNQTVDIFEFIIVNDNPARVELVDFLQKYENDYSSIIVLNNTRNSGLIFSLNLAIHAATGDYIARMDADDVSMLNRFESQLKYLKENELDLIGANINFVDESRVKFSHSNKVTTNKYILKLLEHGVISIVHPTFFGKAEVFKSCYYNKKALYAEDMEFILNASAKGYILGNCSEILLDCRYSNSSITKLKTIQMEDTVKNIKFSFKMYRQKGEYVFLVKESDLVEKESGKVVLVKEYLTNARSSYADKKYFSMALFLISAFLSSPESFLSSFKARALINYYRFIEKLS